MLNIYTSNKIESLIGQLSYTIKSAPLTSPFTQEIIAVNNSAMKKWLQINISQTLGVEANYDFPLPASLLWSILGQHFQQLPAQDPLSREHLHWQVFSRLPSLLDLPEFSVLKNYIKADKNGLKRWQLSARIADVFDRYQYYRPNFVDLVGVDNQWQAALWEQLSNDVQHHKIQVVDHYLADCQAGLVRAEHIPDRISLFAPSTLPPLVLKTLLQLAEITQIDFYLLAPTNQYWLDLVSQKVEAKARLKNPDEAVYLETGNRLLSSWGRQGQVFFDQLISISEQAEEFQHFQEPDTDSVLAQIKHDIYDLQDADFSSEKILADGDNSIVIHICHSPLREIQVLHDQLLDLFETNADLKPEDILIVAPNISQYAPYVEAIFRKTDNKPFIPWNLSDTTADEDIPLIRIFLQLFNLPDSRFGRSEVLAYLDVPEVRQKFNLNEEEVESIRAWLDSSATRWAKSQKHKTTLGLPAVPQNTWEQTKERLFMGYAIGKIDSLFEDISPVSQVEGKVSEALGKFWRLYSTLENYSQRLRHAQSLSAWHKTINQLLDSFFDDSWQDDSHLQFIRDSVDDLIQGIHDNAVENLTLDEPISRQLLRLILEEKLSDSANLHAFMSGGVSFSGFKPMRNLPFKVIALLGMNDGRFPRQTTKVEFDLMQQHYQVGDPNTRDEDRYLFLETLLSAQDKLIISYVGRSVKDNTEKQPSVLVKELLDYLDIRFCSTAGSTPYSQHISQPHRLQAYHASYFQTPSSYDKYWCKVAEQINQSEKNDTIPWESKQLEEPDAAWRELDINRLLRFFRHPIRNFFQQRLGIYLNDQNEHIDDDEPFALDFLQQYLLKARLLEEWQQDRTQTYHLETIKSQLCAEGILPHGQNADDIMKDIREAMEPLFERAGELLCDEQAEPLALSLKLTNDISDNWSVSGSLSNIYPALGLVEIKSGKLSGIDQLSFWIKYMAYRLEAPEAYCMDGYFVDIEKTYTVKAESISQENAEHYLQDLLRHYWLGVCKPLALLPKSSYEMMKQLAKGKEFSGEENPSWKSDGAFNSPIGDLHDPYVKLALRGASDLPINTQEFIDVSTMAYQFDLTQ